ncbi:MAG: hypothetical protein JW795_16370, partial [Chitinivibrionales bacterium]|nr:hypothetical protein [Chitinivibrionales bacterium]
MHWCTLDHQDLLGFFSDILITLTILPIVLVSRRIHWSFSVLILVGWGLIHHFHGEHVLANDDLISILHSANAFHVSFLLGSAIKLSHLFLFIVVMALGLLSFLIPCPRLTMIQIVGLYLVTGAGFLIHSTNNEVLSTRWRIYHVLHGNWIDVWQYLTEKYQKKEEINSQLVMQRLSAMKADTSGYPTVEGMGDHRYNILLLVLESTSGSLLPSLQQSQSMHSDITMPILDSISRENITYVNFLTHQRQTNRGMFSILSGTYPKLNSSTPKMTE